MKLTIRYSLDPQHDDTYHGCTLKHRTLYWPDERKVLVTPIITSELKAQSSENFNVRFVTHESFGGEFYENYYSKLGWFKMQRLQLMYGWHTFQKHWQWWLGIPGVVITLIGC